MLDRGAALDRPGVEDEDVHERAVSRHLLGELENGLSLPEVAAVGPETTASCRDLGSRGLFGSRELLTPMTSAPASASAMAAALPIPRRQPVTRAVFPSRGRLMSCSRRES